MEIAVHLPSVSEYLAQFHACLDYREKGSIRPITTEQISFLLQHVDFVQIFTKETLSRLDILLKQGTPIHMTFEQYVTYAFSS